MKVKSSLNSSCFNHVKRRLSLIIRILVNTRPILLLVVSLTSLLAQSRLYKGELCLLRVQYHSLLGYTQGCLSTEEVRLCHSMYSPYWEKPRLQCFIRSTCELPPYWIIPGFNCVNTKENTLMIHVVSYQFTNMQIRLDLAYKLSEHNAFTFPITIPTHKFNIAIINVSLFPDSTLRSWLSKL